MRPREWSHQNKRERYPNAATALVSCYERPMNVPEFIFVFIFNLRKKRKYLRGRLETTGVVVLGEWVQREPRWGEGRGGCQNKRERYPNAATALVSCHERPMNVPESIFVFIFNLRKKREYLRGRPETTVVVVLGEWVQCEPQRG